MGPCDGRHDPRAPHPRSPRPFGGVQPRRQDRGHRGRGPDGAALGRRHRRGDRFSDAAGRSSRGDGIQPRWQDLTHRGSCRARGLGRRHGPANGLTAQTIQISRVRGLQPGRAEDSGRRRRCVGATAGRDHRPAARPPSAASRESHVDGAEPRWSDCGDILRQRRGALMGRRRAAGRSGAHRVLGPVQHRSGLRRRGADEKP